MKPLRRSPTAKCRSTGRLDLEVLHAAAHLLPFRARRYPLSGLGSLQSITRTPPHRAAFAEATASGAPSEVWSPSASSRPCGATYLRRVPNPPVTLRPQGLSPSRRFAPRKACRACFIPVPLLGFSLRGLVPPAAPYVLSNAGALMELAVASVDATPPLQGFCARRRKPARETRGLARLPASVPPWDFAPPGFVARSGDDPKVVGPPRASPARS